MKKAVIIIVSSLIAVLIGATMSGGLGNLQSNALLNPQTQACLDEPQEDATSCRALLMTLQQALENKHISLLVQIERKQKQCEDLESSSSQNKTQKCYDVLDGFLTQADEIQKQLQDIESILK